MNLTREVGCCYNSFVAITTSVRYVKLIQYLVFLDCQISGSMTLLDETHAAILTREIYEFCGVQSPGICDGVSTYNNKFNCVMYVLLCRWLLHQLLMLLKDVFQLEISTVKLRPPASMM